MNFRPPGGPSIIRNVLGQPPPGAQAGIFLRGHEQQMVVLQSLAPGAAKCTRCLRLLVLRRRAPDFWLLHPPSPLVHRTLSIPPTDPLSLQVYATNIKRIKPTIEPTICRGRQAREAETSSAGRRPFLAHRRRGKGGRRRLFFSVCHLPRHFVEAGFSRAAFRRNSV